MAQISTIAYYDGHIVNHADASLPITSSAVLYGMSVYTVALLSHTPNGLYGFRLGDHFRRLRESAAMIGMRDADYSDEHLSNALQLLVRAVAPTRDMFARITIHATADIPGVRTAGITPKLSIFLYDATAILPMDGASLKTSTFRRTRDDAIPARAKVNGAYVNSCLAKQDAMDSGCDDALFLNHDGFVSELTAANIFLVRDNTLITPDTASDILEGITRRTIIDAALRDGITVCERRVALTEVYTADEVFACGTSTFVAPITSVDHRCIGDGTIGVQTRWAKEILTTAQRTDNEYTTLL